MKIKFLSNINDKRVDSFRNLIVEKFPQLFEEKDPELYLVAGGDGAMLHAIQETIDHKIPYIGKSRSRKNTGYIFTFV